MSNESVKNVIEIDFNLLAEMDFNIEEELHQESFNEGYDVGFKSAEVMRVIEESMFEAKKAVDAASEMAEEYEAISYNAYQAGINVGKGMSESTINGLIKQVHRLESIIEKCMSEREEELNDAFHAGFEDGSRASNEYAETTVLGLGEAFNQGFESGRRSVTSSAAFKECVEKEVELCMSEHNDQEFERGYCVGLSKMANDYEELMVDYQFLRQAHMLSSL